MILLLSLAFAEELVPIEGKASLVRAADGGGVYYPLSPGEGLDFTVYGPVELNVEARQRLITADAPIDQVTVSAQGDGMHILTIQVEAEADATGTIMDGVGGVPSTKDTAHITVPAGEHTFTLAYDEGATPLLLKVSTEQDMVRPEAELPQPEVTEPEPEPEVAEPEPEPEVAEPETEPEFEIEFMEPEPAPILPNEVDLGEPAPPKEPSLAIGVRVGLGNARAGNRASLYLGGELQKPLSDVWALSVRLGRYGIGLDADVPIQPAIGQYDGVTQNITWSTRVRQLDLGAQYSTALGAGFRGYVQPGVVGYHATRVDGEERVRGAALGLGLAFGLAIDVGPGTLPVELAFNTGRRSFGNEAATGGDARESLSVARLNLAWTMSF